MLVLQSVLTFAQSSIIGFEADQVGQQKALEAEFDTMLSADNLDQWMKFMSGEPHYLGTEYGRKNAEWMVKQFKSWGIGPSIGPLIFVGFAGFRGFEAYLATVVARLPKMS